MQTRKGKIALSFWAATCLCAAILLLLCISSFWRATNNQDTQSREQLSQMPVEVTAKSETKDPQARERLERLHSGLMLIQNKSNPTLGISAELFESESFQFGEQVSFEGQNVSNFFRQHHNTVHRYNRDWRKGNARIGDELRSYIP
jgi:hypothetical protein